MRSLEPVRVKDSIYPKVPCYLNLISLNKFKNILDWEQEERNYSNYLIVNKTIDEEYNHLGVSGKGRIMYSGRGGVVFDGLTDSFYSRPFSHGKNGAVELISKELIVSPELYEILIIDFNVPLDESRAVEASFIKYCLDDLGFKLSRRKTKIVEENTIMNKKREREAEQLIDKLLII